MDWVWAMKEGEGTRKTKTFSAMNSCTNGIAVY